MAGERQSIYIDNEALNLLLRGQNSAGKDGITALLTEDDGTIRTWALQVSRDDDGNERVTLVEDDGTLRQQLVLWETTTPGQVRALAEDDGTLKVSAYGSDEAGNLDSVRTDPDRIPWTRPYEGFRQVDSVEVPAADGVLYNPGATAAQIYEVEYEVINNDAGGAAVTVSIGVDRAAGGALAAPEYWMFNEIIPYPGTSARRPGGLIAGDDDVRGVASIANDASIRFWVRRVDTGA